MSRDCHGGALIRYRRTYLHICPSGPRKERPGGVRRRRPTERALGAAGDRERRGANGGRAGGREGSRASLWALPSTRASAAGRNDCHSSASGSSSCIFGCDTVPNDPWPATPARPTTRTLPPVDLGTRYSAPHLAPDGCRPCLLHQLFASQLARLSCRPPSSHTSITCPVNSSRLHLLPDCKSTWRSRAATTRRCASWPEGAPWTSTSSKSR